MIRDGVALVRFFRWLEKNIDSGKVTEITVAEKLREFRSQQSLYVGESFATIAGFNEHGAIVHYSATPESNAIISRKGFLLIDSGAQYLDGTTDITRTVSLGNLSPRQKRDFTLVMKGHIALATCHYPQGTRGAQLECPRPPFPMGRSPQLLARDWSRSRAFPQCPRGTAKHTPRRKSHASHAGHDYL